MREVKGSFKMKPLKTFKIQLCRLEAKVGKIIESALVVPEPGQYWEIDGVGYTVESVFYEEDREIYYTQLQLAPQKEKPFGSNESRIEALHNAIEILEHRIEYDGFDLDLLKQMLIEYKELVDVKQD